MKKNEVVAVIDAPEVEEQYQQAVSDYKIKKLTYERLAKVWKESPDVIAKQDVDVAEASYQGAKHLMEQRVVLRDYTKVRAPYDGIVTARFADPGAPFKSPPPRPPVPFRCLRSWTSTPCGSTRMCRKTIALGRGRQDHSHGQGHGTPRPLIYGHRHAVHIGTLDPATRSLLVEIDIPNSDHALRPGTFAEVSLGLREIPQALCGSAAGRHQHTQREVPVRRRRGQGQVHHRPKPGSATVIGWRSRPGCVGDEEVVAVGKRRLLDGTPVQPSPFNLPEAKTSQQKFERRAPGGTPPPPGNPFNGSAPKQGDRP